MPDGLPTSKWAPSLTKVAAKASSAASVFEEENELPVAGYSALLLPEALNAENPWDNLLVDSETLEEVHLSKVIEEFGTPRVTSTFGTDQYDWNCTPARYLSRSPVRFLGPVSRRRTTQPSQLHSNWGADSQTLCAIMMFCWNAPIPVWIVRDLMQAVMAHAAIGIAGTARAYALEDITATTVKFAVGSDDLLREVLWRFSHGLQFVLIYKSGFKELDVQLSSIEDGEDEEDFAIPSNVNMPVAKHRPLSRSPQNPR